MKKIRLMVIGLTAALIAGSAVYGQDARRDEVQSRKRDGKYREAIFKELNLTDEQKAALDANRKEQGEKMAQLREEMHEKQTKLREELDNPKVSREAMEPLVTEVKALQAQLIDLRLNAIFAVKGILTVEQFAKFQEISQRHHKKMKKEFFRKFKGFGKDKIEDEG